MSYAIMRIKKYHSPGHMTSNRKHCTRESLPKNADPDRQKMNVDFISSGGKFIPVPEGKTYDTAEKLAKVLPEKRRKNAVVGVEFMITSSPEWWKNKDQKTVMEWTYHALDWLQKKHGSEKIISATLHQDETSPHLHVMTVPVVDGKLNARSMYSGREKLSALQDDFFEHMAKKFPDLERGIKGSKAKHTTVRQFYQAIEAVNSDKIKQPTKSGPMDIGYTKRLETFVDQIKPLVVSTGVLEEKRRSERATGVKLERELIKAQKDALKLKEGLKEGQEALKKVERVEKVFTERPDVYKTYLAARDDIQKQEVSKKRSGVDLD